MASIAVSRAFTVLLDGGQRYSYAPGLHKDVPEEVANHWWTKLFLSPDGEEPANTETVAPDSNGIAFLVQAKAAAEDAAERLRAELRRITDAWNETDTALRRVTAERDALRTQLAESETGAPPVADKVHSSVNVSDVSSAQQPEETFAIRKRGKYFQIAKTTGSETEVVDQFENRAEADARLEELKNA